MSRKYPQTTKSRVKIGLCEARKHRTEGNRKRKRKRQQQPCQRQISVVEHYLTTCQRERMLNLFVRWFLLLQGLVIETVISMGQAKLCFPQKIKWSDNNNSPNHNVKTTLFQLRTHKHRLTQTSRYHCGHVPSCYCPTWIHQ